MRDIRLSAVLAFARWLRIPIKVRESYWLGELPAASEECSSEAISRLRA